jgi:endonuclease/exonuclease/phosphatase (EEP) superfamily protein YafD
MPILHLHQNHSNTITVITETWLNRPIASHFEGVKIIQSPPNQHQGILIIMDSKKITRINPILTEFWTTTTVAAIITLVDEKAQTEAIIIAHYSPPLQQKTTDQELIFIANNARRKHPRHEIILTGDLNRDPTSARKLALKLNLQIC